MSIVYAVNAPRLYVGHKPVRDPNYLRFLKRFPCVGCGKRWGIDPSHTGPHGVGIKSDDTDALPMCRKCHDEFGANPVRFAERRGLNMSALIQMFQRFYKRYLETTKHIVKSRCRCHCSRQKCVGSKGNCEHTSGGTSPPNRQRAAFPTIKESEDNRSLSI